MKVTYTFLDDFSFVRYHAVLNVIHLVLIYGCVYIVAAIRLAVENYIMIIAPYITGFVH